MEMQKITSMHRVFEVGHHSEKGSDVLFQELPSGSVCPFLEGVCVFFLWAATRSPQCLATPRQWFCVSECFSLWVCLCVYTGCYKITTVFSHAQTVVLCVSVFHCGCVYVFTQAATRSPQCLATPRQWFCASVFFIVGVFMCLHRLLQDHHSV